MSTALVDTRSVRAACEQILETFADKQAQARDALLAEKRRSIECRWFKYPPSLSIAARTQIAAIGRTEIGTAKELIDLCDVAEAYGDPRIALSSRHASILKRYMRQDTGMHVTRTHDIAAH